MVFKIKKMKKNIFEFLHLTLYNFIKIISSFHGLIVEIHKKNLKNVLFFLKNNERCYYKMLIDIFAVDFLQKNNRFNINYLLRSLKFNFFLTLNLFLNDIFTVDSITFLYKNANWCEREIWDMNGIFFNNHPDLRRILTDYGFSGFPLRKDFPISGFKEVRYDDGQKRVIQERIELSQEFRVFNFERVWKK